MLIILKSITIRTAQFLIAQFSHQFRLVKPVKICENQ